MLHLACPRCPPAVTTLRAPNLQGSHPPTLLGSVCLNVALNPGLLYFLRREENFHLSRTDHPAAGDRGWLSGGRRPANFPGRWGGRSIMSHRKVLRQAAGEERKGPRTCCSRVHESNNNEIQPARERSVVLGPCWPRPRMFVRRLPWKERGRTVRDKRGVTVLCPLSKGAGRGST